jgi:hypothetical protein
MAEGDYGGAFEYIYSFSSDVQTKEDFESRFKNIYEALEINGITLLNWNVGQKSDDEDETE